MRAPGPWWHTLVPPREAHELLAFLGGGRPCLPILPQHVPFGVSIQRGIVASTAEEAVAAAEKLTAETGTSWWVIKAQVHAGGRGKGGGVKLAKSLAEVKSISNDILGMHLVTPQTSKEGKLVHQVLIAEDV